MNEESTNTKPAERPQRDPTTTVVAWVATLIATLALAGGLYLEKEREKLKDRINDVRFELHDSANQLARRDAEFADRDALARVEGEAARRVQELERRLDQLAAGVEYLRTQGDGARSSWIRAEMEHVLRLAIEHLEVAHDPRAALVALRAVERRMQDSGEPAYAPVLERVTLDIAALERVAVPDVEGITLTLDAMANRVASLPIAQPEGTAPRLRRVREAGFAGVDWSGLWRRVRESFRSMVTVRREGRPTRALVAPEEEMFVHLNTQLKLEGIRVAALQRDNIAYRTGLRNVRAWVESWYRADDPTVVAMLGELSRLEEHDLAPALPDLSSTLRLLRGADDRRGQR